MLMCWQKLLNFTRFQYPSQTCVTTHVWLRRTISWHNQSQPKDSVLRLWVLIGQSLIRYEESELYQHWADDDKHKHICRWRNVTHLDQCAEGHQDELLHENCWLSSRGGGRGGRGCICNALTIDYSQTAEWNWTCQVHQELAGGKADRRLNEQLFTTQHAPSNYNLQLEGYWLSALNTRMRPTGHSLVNSQLFFIYRLPDERLSNRPVSLLDFFVLLFSRVAASHGPSLHHAACLTSEFKTDLAAPWGLPYPPGFMIEMSYSAAGSPPLGCSVWRRSCGQS